MGIGNTPSRPPWRAPRGLITPHGDRKPGSRAPGHRPMTKLITPHGDRKRPAAAGAPRPPRTCGAHYPSWGSETPHHIPRAGEHIRLLITPHGDRKRWANAPTSAAARSHYPSWGSETRRRRHRHRPLWSHYPSWGSETSLVGPRSTPACTPPHYPSWGSETRPSTATRR